MVVGCEVNAARPSYEEEDPTLAKDIVDLGLRGALDRRVGLVLAGRNHNPGEFVNLRAVNEPLQDQTLRFVGAKQVIEFIVSHPFDLPSVAGHKVVLLVDSRLVDVLVDGNLLKFEGQIPGIVEGNIQVFAGHENKSETRAGNLQILGDRHVVLVGLGRVVRDQFVDPVDDVGQEEGDQEDGGHDAALGGDLTGYWDREEGEDVQGRKKAKKPGLCFAVFCHKNGQDFEYFN